MEEVKNDQFWPAVQEKALGRAAFLKMFFCLFAFCFLSARVHCKSDWEKQSKNKATKVLLVTSPPP